MLDEIGMCDPRIIGETVYMLGNGTGKARANDRGQAGRQVQEWRLLFPSTGDKTLTQHMAEANKELKAGMEVRMLAVPADASKGSACSTRSMVSKMRPPYRTRSRPAWRTTTAH